MDIIKKIQNMKDTKVKEEALTMVRQTLERNDEEFYFEEETIDIEGRNYIKKRLKKKNDHYFFIDDLKYETAYCINCFDKNGQLNKVVKNGNRESGEFICLVCSLSEK